MFLRSVLYIVVLCFSISIYAASHEAADSTGKGVATPVRAGAGAGAWAWAEAEAGAGAGGVKAVLLTKIAVFA